GIEGISVVVKGTGVGTSTDEDGYFSLINIDANAILIFTSVNVDRREVSVNSRSILPPIKMKTKITQENEVTVTVNTGYQTLSKERSAGSYAKPNMKIVDN